MRKVSFNVSVPLLEAAEQRAREWHGHIGSIMMASLLHFLETVTTEAEFRRLADAAYDESAAFEMDEKRGRKHAPTIPADSRQPSPHQHTIL